MPVVDRERFPDRCLSTEQGATPWPPDDYLVGLAVLLGTMTDVAAACGKSRSALRDYLSVRPKLYREIRRLTPAKRTYNVYVRANRLRFPLTKLGREFAAVIRQDPCCYCGERGGTVDHIQAVRAGGSGDWDNITGACSTCNSAKRETPLLHWMLANA